MPIAKKQNKRPKPRPVLQFRVHPDLYAALAKAAKAAKISISQEAEARIRMSIFGKQEKEDGR